MRALARVGALCALAGCVTTYEDAPLVQDDLARPEFAVPQTIPIEAASQDPNQLLVAQFYAVVLRQLHEAAEDGDLPQLEALLASHARDDLPPALRDRVRGYRDIARGLRFSREAAQRAAVALGEVPAGEEAPPLEDGLPALGAVLRLELQLPAGAIPVTLGGRDDADPIGFLVAVTIDDSFVEGSTRSSSTNRFLWLPESFVLAGDAVLRLPVEIDLPGATAVRRDVHVRVDLMPGYVMVDGHRAPITQTAIAARTMTQWPVGYGTVAAAPLRELQAALQSFTPKTFPRAFLAAAATRGADRETAIDLLLEQVRFGRADQAQVAMAALRSMTGLSFLVGDRDAWLAWSRDRR